VIALRRPVDRVDALTTNNHGTAVTPGASCPREARAVKAFGAAAAASTGARELRSDRPGPVAASIGDGSEITSRPTGSALLPTLARSARTDATRAANTAVDSA